MASVVPTTVEIPEELHVIGADDMPEQVQVADVGCRERPYENPSVQLVHHEPFVTQQPKRLAQGVAGDPQRLADALFGQPDARLEKAAGDLLTEDLGHPFRGA